MIKVLHIELTDNLGGIESLLLNISERMDWEKFQFDFITSHPATFITEKFERMGCKVFHVPSPRNVFFYMSALSNIIRQGQYDVVWLHKNSAANMLPLYIAKMCGVPRVIVHSHNTEPTAAGVLPRVLHRVNRALFPLFRIRKLACSREAAVYMFGKADGVTLVRNGIDLEYFRFDEEARRRVRETYQIPAQALVVGEVASLTVQKNHKFLLDAFSKMDASAYLLLVGQGPLEGALREQAARLHIADRVIFAGMQKDVAPFLSAMDIFAMPSFHEGLSISAVEAQASGLPVYMLSDVDRDVNVSGYVKFLPIDDSGRWAREMKPGEDRVAMQCSKDCGYDIQSTVAQVQEVLSDVCVHGST